jgi:hypothetical protein
MGCAAPIRSSRDRARLAHANVTLLTHAFVQKLVTDATGRSVRQVVVEREGRMESYSADVVVVACGAINSAALLLRSGSDKHPEGLANSPARSAAITPSMEMCPKRFGLRTRVLRSLLHSDVIDGTVDRLHELELLGDATLASAALKWWSLADVGTLSDSLDRRAFRI